VFIYPPLSINILPCYIIYLFLFFDDIIFNAKGYNLYIINIYIYVNNIYNI
jgi:hypothetical protein